MAKRQVEVPVWVSLDASSVKPLHRQLYDRLRAGMHLVGWGFPLARTTRRPLVGRAAGRRSAPISPYRIREDVRGGLMLGYAGSQEPCDRGFRLQAAGLRTRTEAETHCGKRYHQQRQRFLEWTIAGPKPETEA